MNPTTWRPNITKLTFWPILFALALLLALWAVTQAADPITDEQVIAEGEGIANTLSRQRDPVVVVGAALPEFTGAPLDSLFAYAFDGTDWQQIPFQWDEVEAIGSTYVALEDGLLDVDDQLAFMALDAGLQPPPGSWIDDQASTGYARYELAISDPLNPGQFAWVYIYRSPQLEPSYGPDYVRVADDAVATPFYTGTVNFSETLGLTGLSLSNNPTDILDQSHISIKGRVLVLPVQYCEDDIAGLITGTAGITDIVPVGDYPVRFVTGTVDSPSTAVYPASLRFSLGSLDLDELAASIPLPGVTLDELRITIDLLDPAASGFAPARYYDANADPAGMTVDGMPDPVPDTVTAWTQHSGSFGSIIQLNSLETSGTTASTYYLDDSGATASDCHGSDGAYGESGVRIAPFTGQVTVTQQLYFAEPLDQAAGQTYLAYAANPLEAVGTAQTTCYFADVEPNSDRSVPELCDNDVDVADVERIAGCWAQAAGDPGCPTSLDLTLDGLIDVLDIVLGADQWNWFRPG